WEQLERVADDHRQRAERPGHQASDVIPRDVLHDDATGFCGDAIGPDNVDADDQITRRAVAMPARTGIIGCNDPANGGAFAPRRIERQPLVETRELAVDGLER